MEKPARNFHREPLICIERVEPHARHTRPVMQIGAQIHLHEIRDARHRGQKARTDIPHEKWHDTEIRLAAEGIDEQPLRQRRLNRRRGILPVQEKQIAPLLKHHRPPRRTYPRRETLRDIGNRRSCVGGGHRGEAGGKWAVMKFIMEGGNFVRLALRLSCIAGNIKN